MVYQRVKFLTMAPTFTQCPTKSRQNGPGFTVLEFPGTQWLGKNGEGVVVLQPRRRETVMEKIGWGFMEDDMMWI